MTEPTEPELPRRWFDRKGGRRFWNGSTWPAPVGTTVPPTAVPAVSAGFLSNRIKPPFRARRKGQRMQLTSLAPKYSKAHHQLYADLVKRAISHPDSRNVALTGAYGVGKSSVLGDLKQPRGLRFWRPVVVELSLSTLDPDRAPESTPTNPAEATRSNRIQKEIVKQLLYRLPTGRTPSSRFPRASKLSWPYAVGSSLGLAVAAVPVVYVVLALTGSMTGLDARLEALRWSSTWFWILATAGLTLLFLILRWLVNGRVQVSGSLKAGPATVTLEPTSTSYFDQYLDEIVYFFQVSRAGVVLIEDVDRFDDALVFDTLRALNGLLNASKQIGRRVVFVYAVRDSVLQEIGRAPRQQRDKARARVEAHQLASSPSPVDPVAAVLERANHTKFFDVIIPVVPFITADNARELMMQVMAPKETKVSPALIRLAARHVADMRLIHSIRNEFEVYCDRLRDAGTPAPGINEDVILALVLLKVTNPVDYEAIRLKKSSLDRLHTRWRDLVNENLATETAKRTDLRTRLGLSQTLNSRADLVGQRLERLRDSMRSWAEFEAESVTLEGPVTDSDPAATDAWREVALGEPQKFRLNHPRYAAHSVPLKLDASQLADLIGIPIDPDQWARDDLADLAERIADAEEQIRYLRHHTWKDLTQRRPHITVAAEGAQSDRPARGASFDQLVDQLLPTPLARELVRHGFLTRHFARYASMFYGRDLGLDAAEYIDRYIDPGVPEFDYELTPEAVGQILREEDAERDDADLFDDPSVYNVDLINYLLQNRPRAAARVATRLSRWETLEREFVDIFVARSKYSAALVGLMAPTWDTAVRYTTVDAPVDPRVRVELVDAVLAAIPAGERGDLDHVVAGYLTATYRNLATITHPADANKAATVMDVVAASGASLFSVQPLATPAARAAAVERAVYPVTAENLVELSPEDSIALDVLRNGRGTVRVYDHAVAHLEDYLLALEHSETASAVEDAAEFAVVLTDVARAHADELVTRFIDATDPVCRVADLRRVPPETWPALVARVRTSPTFVNVRRYLETYSLDESLGALLADGGEISGAAEAALADRLTIAIEILGAREVIRDPATRVALAVSLDPSVIPAAEIKPEDGNLVALLLPENLMADDASAFEPRLMRDWNAFETAVAASEVFRDIAEPSILSASRLPKLMRSNLVPDETKDALVLRLTALLPGADGAEGTAIADVLADQKRKLSAVQLRAVWAVGAGDDSFVRLLDAQADHLDHEDLKDLLRGMGGNYEKVANNGIGTPKFPVDEWHLRVLSRLEGDTHSGVKMRNVPSRGGDRYVTPLLIRPRG